MALARIDYPVSNYEYMAVYPTKGGKRIIVNIENIHLYFTLPKFDELRKKVNEIKEGEG